ncbi:MAG: hypothetical protein M3Y87_27695 [Myxococcota bacterium]|nr:hypothetical protein [Myxococcota bacterium]
MRNWKSVAVGSAWLLAAACGGNEGETARADLETDTMGGERAATDRQMGGEATTDPSAGASYDVYVVDPAPPVAVIPPPSAGEPGSEWMSEGEQQDPFAQGSQQPGTTQQDPFAQGTQQPGTTQQDPFAQGTRQPGTTQQDPFAQGTQQPQDTFGQTGALAQVCPADIEGLNVRVSTIPRGGALVFTVDREEVQVLRDRLDRFAQLHRQHHEGMQPGAGMHGMEHGEGSMGSAQGTPSGGASGSVGAGGAGASGSIGGGMAQGGQQQQFADQEALIHQASEVRVVEIPRGARLEFRFDDAERVSDLRSELRESATMLRDGRCPLALQLES